MNQYNIPIINNIDCAKINRAFKEISNLVTQILNKVTRILSQAGIKYFNKPNHQMLMRLLTPQQLKVYIDMTDVYCLFQNRSELINTNLNQNNLMLNAFQLTKMQDNKNVSDLFINYGNQTREKSLQKRKKIIQSSNLSGIQSSMESRSKYNQNLTKKAHKKMIADMLANQVIEWVKNQAKKGKIIKRRDVFLQAKQFAKIYRMKIGGQRWFKSFLSRYSHIKKYLTHGNSGKIMNMGSKRIYQAKQQQNYEAQSQQIKSEQLQYQMQQQEDYNSIDDVNLLYNEQSAYNEQ